jgi:hypothetical protein
VAFDQPVLTPHDRVRGGGKCGRDVVTGGRAGHQVVRIDQRDLALLVSNEPTQVSESRRQADTNARQHVVEESNFSMPTTPPA